MTTRLRIPYDVLSDQELLFTEKMKLPTFSVGKNKFIKRLTLIIEKSISLSIWCAIMSLIVGVTHFSRRKDELIPAIKNIDLKKIGQIE